MYYGAAENTEGVNAEAAYCYSNEKDLFHWFLENVLIHALALTH